MSIKDKILVVVFGFLILWACISYGWGWGIKMQRDGQVDDLPDFLFTNLRHWVLFAIIVLCVVKYAMWIWGFFRA